MFVASIPLYLFLGYLIHSQASRSAASQTSLILPILVAVAVIDLAFGFFYYRRSFSDAALTHELRSAMRDSTEDLQREEQRLLGLLPYIQNRMIIIWAVIEAAAIYGLLLVLMRFGYVTMLPFAAVALIGMILARPRLEQIMEGAQRLLGRI
jgi:hypothetical protein